MAAVLPSNLGLEWDELPDRLELECGKWNGVDEWHEWNGKEGNDRVNTGGWECCAYSLVLFGDLESMMKRSKIYILTIMVLCFLFIFFIFCRMSQKRPE